MIVTAANAADVTKLLHGAEKVVCADARYTEAEKREEHAGLQVIRQIAQHLQEARQAQYLVQSSPQDRESPGSSEGEVSDAACDNRGELPRQKRPCCEATLTR